MMVFWQMFPLRFGLSVTVDFATVREHRMTEGKTLIALRVAKEASFHSRRKIYTHRRVEEAVFHECVTEELASPLGCETFNVIFCRWVWKSCFWVKFWAARNVAVLHWSSCTAHRGQIIQSRGVCLYINMGLWSSVLVKNLPRQPSIYLFGPYKPHIYNTSELPQVALWARLNFS